MAREYIAPCLCVELDVRQARAREPYKLLVYGFSDLGKSIMERLIVDAQLCGGKPTVTVLCQNSAQTATEYLSARPQLQDCAEVTFVEAIGNPQEIFELSKPLRFGCSCSLIATGDDSFSAQLERAIGDNNVIVADSDYYDELPDFETAAMQINLFYRQNRGDKLAVDAKEAWNELNELTRESNVSALANMPTKLRLLGLNSRASCEQYLCSKEQYTAYVGKARMERLSKQEHYRWNAFHLVHGWQTLTRYESDILTAKNGKRTVKDLERKLHICIVDWDTLDELADIDPNYKQYDTDNVLNIQKLWESFEPIKRLLV